MNRHFDRFEHFKTASGDVIFDRKTHTLLNNSGHLSSVKELKSNDKIVFSLFPHKVLSHIKIPSIVFTFFIAKSFFTFIVISIFISKWICIFSATKLWLMFLIEFPILIVSVLMHELSHAIIAIKGMR